VKETVVYMVIIATRDVIIEEWLKYKKEPDNKSYRYTAAEKKDGIIIGHLTQKISQACRITFTILTLHNSLLLWDFVFCHSIFLVLHDLPKL